MFFFFFHDDLKIMKQNNATFGEGLVIVSEVRSLYMGLNFPGKLFFFRKMLNRYSNVFVSFNEERKID
jgi:hypothetical protein